MLQFVEIFGINIIFIFLVWSTCELNKSVSNIYKIIDRQTFSIQNFEKYQSLFIITTKNPGIQTSHLWTNEIRKLHDKNR